MLFALLEMVSCLVRGYYSLGEQIFEAASCTGFTCPAPLSIPSSRFILSQELHMGCIHPSRICSNSNDSVCCLNLELSMVVMVDLNKTF